VPRSYSMAKRAQAREETRQRVMAAATELVLAGGSTTLTMTAVAERADVALRTVYNHFATVDDLFAAVMGAINDEFAALAPEPVDAENGSPEAALRELTRQWFAEIARHADRLAALLTIRGSAGLDRALAAARQIRLERVRSIMAAAERRGLLRAPLDDAVAMAYVETSYQTWAALVPQLGMTTDDAADLVTRSIGAFAFRRRPGVPRS
jgi:AcrR family transcriptional regulator